ISEYREATREIDLGGHDRYHAGHAPDCRSCAYWRGDDCNRHERPWIRDRAGDGAGSRRSGGKQKTPAQARRFRAQAIWLKHAARKWKYVPTFGRHALVWFTTI